MASQSKIFESAKTAESFLGSEEGHSDVVVRSRVNRVRARWQTVLLLPMLLAGIASTTSVPAQTSNGSILGERHRSNRSSRARRRRHPGEQRHKCHSREQPQVPAAHTASST